MRLVLIYLSVFTAKWIKWGLTDDDLRALEIMLITDPESGDLIPGTGGLRKLRFAPRSWRTGKRGATRVIYAHIATAHSVYLFTIYGKNEQADLTADEKKVFRSILERLRSQRKK